MKKLFPETDEKIVYKIVSLPGGVDGLDSSDKGGAVTAVYLTRQEAEEKCDAWSAIRPEIVDFKKVYRQVMNNLSKTEELVLRHYYGDLGKS